MTRAKQSRKSRSEEIEKQKKRVDARRISIFSNEQEIQEMRKQERME